MSFPATVYRVLIASPGDLQQERGIIEEVVNQWNGSHAADEGMVLLPVRWETHAVPEYGDRPQAILNRRLVAECDMLIGAFWTRVGTPTGTSESGTIEEIEQLAKAHKPALLYFSSRQIDPDRVDLDQLKRVRELRVRLEQVALIGQFASPEQLESRLTRDLIQQMRRLRSVPQPSTDEATQDPPPKVSEPARPAQSWTAPTGDRFDAATLGALYEEYWSRFSELVARSGLGLRPPIPSTRNYARLSLRSSDMWINAFASVRDRQLGVELVLEDPECKDAIARLRADREEIDRAVGQALEWNELDRSVRIVLSERGFNVANRADWSRQHEWLIEKVRAYQEILLRRIGV